MVRIVHSTYLTVRSREGERHADPVNQELCVDRIDATNGKGLSYQSLVVKFIGPQLELCCSVYKNKVALVTYPKYDCLKLKKIRIIDTNIPEIVGEMTLETPGIWIAGVKLIESDLRISTFGGGHRVLTLIDLKTGAVQNRPLSSS